MPTPKPYLAFVAAALVLLVMPVIVMAGLMAIGLATGAGMMPQMTGLMDGGSAGLVLSLFIVWTALVVTAIVAAIVLISRRSAGT